MPADGVVMPDMTGTNRGNRITNNRIHGTGADYRASSAIWDTATEELFLARDHMGIKPLYWARPPGRNGSIRFASEMHAFDPEWRPLVEPFPPGHAWTPEDGLIHFASAVPETRGRVTVVLGEEGEVVMSTGAPGAMSSRTIPRSSCTHLKSSATSSP